MDLMQIMSGAGEEPPRPPIVINRYLATHNQVMTLLAIITTLNQSLERVDGEEPQGGAKCGGTRVGVEASLLAATNRLDEILADQTRWNLDKIDSVDDTVRRVHQQQIKTLVAQQRSCEEEIRPALILRPRVFSQNGTWFAVYGEEIEGRLVGTGATPEAALLDFEQRYRTEPPQP